MPNRMMIAEIVGCILADYKLPLWGPHGPGHWARVLENGERLTEETGADLEIVRLFAVLHDSQRLNEYHDPDHGPRAGHFALTVLGDRLGLSASRLAILIRACAGHTDELTNPNVTIQTCWDADRLDLGRVGVTPHPSRLCTGVAKHPATIRWAEGRSRFGVVPEFLKTEWGLELGTG
jgi:uncharacterized protein